MTDHQVPTEQPTNPLIVVPVAAFVLVGIASLVGAFAAIVVDAFTTVCEWISCVS